MLTINSPINDLCDVFSIGMEIRNELDFFYYKHSWSATNKHVLEKLIAFRKTKIVDTDDRDPTCTENAFTIDLEFKEYSNRRSGRLLTIILFVSNDECRMVIEYCKDGNPGPYNEYQKYVDIINEKFKRFLN